MNKHRRYIRIALALIAVLLYGLAGIAFNPFILWTSLPLYIAYFQFEKFFKGDNAISLLQCYAFLVPSAGFSLFYHLTWFFDWEGTQTGSSTSALIFIWLPVYAVILGYIGYWLASLANRLRK